MYVPISKIDIPPRIRTGVIEERELFAKMQEDQRAQRKRLRRERLLSALKVLGRGRRA